MTELIRRLQGHHEPREELLFHHLLGHCRPGSRMVEIGAYWACYTAWFLAAVPGSTAVCLEPNPSNAAWGRRNLELNARSATWVSGAAGRALSAELPFLESITDPSARGMVRFLVVSTHDQSISGSPSTHEDCLRVVSQLGGTILGEHSVEESFSGDGLIVASLDRSDAGIAMPEFSRASPRGNRQHVA